MHQWTRELNIIAHNHFLQSALNTWKCLLEVKYIWICTSSFFFQSEFKVMSDTQEQENKEREYKNETTVWTKGQIERSGSHRGHIPLNHFKPSYKYQHIYHHSDMTPLTNFNTAKKPYFRSKVSKDVLWYKLCRQRMRSFHRQPFWFPWLLYQCYALILLQAVKIIGTIIDQIY